MTSTEIAELISEKEKERLKMLGDKETIDQEEINLSRQILSLRLKQKDIQAAQSKARFNLRQVDIDIKNLTNQFWAAKNSGG